MLTRVKVVKWFLICLVGVFCSATWVRGDQGAVLFKQGADSLAAGQYADAVKAFDQVITGYPTSPNIDDAHLDAGFAYLHMGDNANAIDRLAKEVDPKASDSYRGTALYLTGLAQFSLGQKAADKAARDKASGQAAATLSTLIDYIGKHPTPTNNDFLEDAIYYRALAEYQKEDFVSAEKDLQQLLQQFSSSLKKPDYLLLLGSLYAVETNQAVNDKKSPEEIKALAQKALDTFEKVSTDPNALVQANNAEMSKAEVLYLVAQLDPGTEGYQKALDAFRRVRRKEDMIQIQQDRLTQLQKNSAAALSAGGAALATANSRLIDRETSRLNDLKNDPDPVIQALVRIGECYVSMKEADEARTVLHRLIAHAAISPDQQQEVDFQILYSYVLGGQTDKADKALTDYLSKHAGDPQADTISYGIAQKLMERKDYAGALVQADRSLKDFPNGRCVPQVIALKVQALTSLGKVDEARKILGDYIAQNPKSPVANQMLLSKAQGEAAQGDFTAALGDYKLVKDNPAATPDLLAIGTAGYIQALQSLQRYDDVITESKAFATKFPDSKALPSVQLIGALAMDKKGDPGAVAALQAVAKTYPTDDVAPFALSYIVNIYLRSNNVPAMIQAASDLFKAYPTAYSYLVTAADAVGAQYVKDKKFDLAVAEYQNLVDAPKPEIAAAAYNKIGGVWLAAAKAMGAYQSMQLDARAEAMKRMTNAEQAYLTTLKKFPDQLGAVGDALEGLTNALKQQRSWGVLTDATMEATLAKMEADFADHDMTTRFDLAKAGLVFIYKNGDKQFPAALERFKSCINPNPNLALTRQETNQYGALLIAANDYATAIQVYNALLEKADPKDANTLADAYYGLGATYLAQGDLAKAKDYFLKMKALPGGGAWDAQHSVNADYGIALANEQSTQPADQQAAAQSYAVLMKSQTAGVQLQSKAMLGYGRLLEKAGHINKANPNDTENAISYYLQVNTFFGPAAPAVSAEALYLAGQAYEKAGDKANAKAQYEAIKATYKTSAPDWAAKAQAAEDKLGA